MSWRRKECSRFLEGSTSSLQPEAGGTRPPGCSPRTGRWSTTSPWSPATPRAAQHFNVSVFYFDTLRVVKRCKRQKEYFVKGKRGYLRLRVEVFHSRRTSPSTGSRSRSRPSCQSLQKLLRRCFSSSGISKTLIKL